MNKKNPYSIVEEIKMHIHIWLADDRAKDLNSSLKDKLTEMANEIRVADMMEKHGVATTSSADPIHDERKIFIVVFKEKFLEYADFRYEEKITAINGQQIYRVCKRLINEGSSAREYLDWFFDDFASYEANKKFMPPTIGLMVQTWIVDKFIFQVKDNLKMRKRDVGELAVKNAVMALATKALEQYQDKDLGEKILEYSRGRITLSHFSKLFKAFSEKHNDSETPKKLDKILKSV